MVFTSCDSEVDVDLDTVIEDCENQHFFGLNTYDPWSGSGDLSKNLDFGTSDVIAPSLGGPVIYSNASTYNYDVERYHFFNTSNKLFVNVNTVPPANLVPLAGDTPTSQYSHLVYVSALASNYIIEIDNTGFLHLVQVNVDSGDILATTPTGFEIDVSEVQSISMTTNNMNEVYIIINRTLITINLDTAAVSLIEVEAPMSTNNLFFGLEYNVSEGYLNAIRLEQFSDAINLVRIDLGGALSIGYSLSSDITDFTTILNQFYSTTLSCDESLYRITSLFGNNNTILHEINRTTGEILSDTIEADYYFGIESNANN
jgi:hypothetical protein